MRAACLLLPVVGCGLAAITAAHAAPAGRCSMGCCGLWPLAMPNCLGAWVDFAACTAAPSLTCSRMQWDNLRHLKSACIAIRLLFLPQEGAAMLPAAALRADPGIALTAGRFGPGLLKAGLVAGQLTGPFSGAWDGQLGAAWSEISRLLG